MCAWNGWQSRVVGSPELGEVGQGADGLGELEDADIANPVAAKAAEGRLWSNAADDGQFFFWGGDGRRPELATTRANATFEDGPRKRWMVCGRGMDGRHGSWAHMSVVSLVRVPMDSASLDAPTSPILLPSRLTRGARRQAHARQTMVSISAALPDALSLQLHARTRVHGFSACKAGLVDAAWLAGSRRGAY